MLSSLPCETLCYITTYLDVQTLLVLKRVCKTTCKVADWQINSILTKKVKNAECPQEVFSLTNNELYLLICILELIQETSIPFSIYLVNTMRNKSQFKMRFSKLSEIRKWTILLYMDININKFERVLLNCKVNDKKLSTSTGKNCINVSKCIYSTIDEMEETQLNNNFTMITYNFGFY